ncbi:lipoyl(octanoyl) transferase LipB [Thaumasiovibrio sp. DFM-14]|uniref:lipoyl(octanoyl) transferase LipB n=1 Tax=Thaumasiovibrio sp. DFM-14 TaxID=3384792 RepID=UPI00399F7F5F
MQSELIIRHLGLCDYQTTYQAMHDFTDHRDADTPDELWLVEHRPVFTQGQAGKEEHLLNTADIPIFQSDRGGQVTYHGPGQLVAYVLVDLRRRKLGVRDLVTHIESSVIDTLKTFSIDAEARPDAPGVYVGSQKICSLGLRIRKGCSFHGLALNVNMDLSPFLRINPCGYAGMEMTQTAQLNGPTQLLDIHPILVQHFAAQLRYKQVVWPTESKV